ncbi:MAG TPA: hypothetical protein VHT91_03345 [Kofleriaceae bacterium]|jgi:hypothetical protein|nr:hypothetical protein [Kofleriaceae bacterium]
MVAAIALVELDVADRVGPAEGRSSQPTPVEMDAAVAAVAPAARHAATTARAARC